LAVIIPIRPLLSKHLSLIINTSGQKVKNKNNSSLAGRNPRSADYLACRCLQAACYPFAYETYSR
jgi:hypothetical protein